MEPLIWLHFLIAILATYRLTVLFTQDAILQPVRVRLPRVPWHCALCMSVWAGAVATLFLWALPWLNWPLALSWLYLAYQQEQAAKQAAKPINAPKAQTMEFTIKLSEGNLNRIMAALGQQKLGDVVDLWLDIKTQVERQLPKAEVIPINNEVSVQK